MYDSAKSAPAKAAQWRGVECRESLELISNPKAKKYAIEIGLSPYAETCNILIAHLLVAYGSAPCSMRYSIMLLFP